MTRPWTKPRPIRSPPRAETWQMRPRARPDPAISDSPDPRARTLSSHWRTRDLPWRQPRSHDRAAVHPDKTRVKSLPRPQLHRVRHDAYCATDSYHCTYGRDLCGHASINPSYCAHNLVKIQGTTPKPEGLGSLSRSREMRLACLLQGWTYRLEDGHGLARRLQRWARLALLPRMATAPKDGDHPFTVLRHTPAWPRIQRERYNTYICNLSPSLWL